MEVFRYKIKDETGLHARPAGLLVKTAQQFSSVITLETAKKTAEATRLMAVMGLGAKRGTELTVRVEGPDETAAAAAMKDFFEIHL